MPQDPKSNATASARSSNDVIADGSPSSASGGPAGSRQHGLSKYKAPKIIYLFDELPKGPSGKILRLQLPALIDQRNNGQA